MSYYGDYDPILKRRPLIKGRRPTGRVPGRPCLPAHERKVMVPLNLAPAQVAWLDAHPQGRSAAARSILSKAMQAAEAPAGDPAVAIAALNKLPFPGALLTAEPSETEAECLEREGAAEQAACMYEAEDARTAIDLGAPAPGLDGTACTEFD